METETQEERYTVTSKNSERFIAYATPKDKDNRKKQYKSSNVPALCLGCVSEHDSPKIYTNPEVAQYDIDTYFPESKDHLQISIYNL